MGSLFAELLLRHVVVGDVVTAMAAIARLTSGLLLACSLLQQDVID
jgi:hypothetical protein